MFSDKTEENLRDSALTNLLTFRLEGEPLPDEPGTYTYPDAEQTVMSTLEYHRRAERGQIEPGQDMRNWEHAMSRWREVTGEEFGTTLEAAEEEIESIPAAILALAR